MSPRSGYQYSTAHFYVTRPEMCEKRGWTRKETVVLTAKLRETLLAEFCLRQICCAGLDKPLMSDDARILMVNAVREDTLRKPKLLLNPPNPGHRYRTVSKPFVMVEEV